MSLQEAVLEGTLKPDGTLELDQKPNLVPGRVKVILQPAQAGRPGQRGLADVIDEIRQSQQARGYSGRSLAEMAAEESERQVEEAEYEQRMQQLLGQSPSNTMGGNP